MTPTDPDQEPDAGAPLDPGLPAESSGGAEAVTTGEGGGPSAEGPSSRLHGRQRILVLVAAGVLVAICAVVVATSFRSESESLVPTLDAWAPYWVAGESLGEVDDRAPSLRELSPFWYAVTGVEDIGLDPNAPAATTAAFLEAARRTGVRIVPSVVDALPAGGMAAILGDPATRARHVDALVAFARDLDADGLDIDYERFAFADDRSSWATTRPAWVAFVTELAAGLHGDGRTLTVSIPPVYDAGRTEDSGYWVYDYGAIAPVVDRIRVMAYDYSTSSPGPIAPLEWIDRVIEGTAAASGDGSKLVLGLPTYGYNWEVGTAGTCPEGQAEGRTGVTARSAADLAARRGATPVYDEATGEWSFSYTLELTDGTLTCTQQREVHYVDSAGALERLERALGAGLAGGSLWALGYEDGAFWDGLAPLVEDPAASTRP